MKTVFLWISFFFVHVLMAQDTISYKHLLESPMILSSGVDFYGKRVSIFAEHWQKKYDSIKRSGLVELLIVQDRKTKKYGYVTLKNEVVIPLEYEQAQPFGYPDKIAWVKKNNKWGAITPQGKLVIPFVYDQAEEFVSDRALVRLDKVWGFVDAKGNTVIPFLYEEAKSFHYDTPYTETKKGGKWGFINKEGETLIPFEYDHIYTEEYYPKSEDKIRVIKNNKMGLINWQNQVVIPLDYTFIYPPTEGIYVVVKEGKKGYITETGKVLTPPIYERFALFHPYKSRFQGGTALVMLGGKYGFINTQGKEIVPCKYEAVKSNYFREGLVPVQYNGKWGYIDKQNKVVIPFVYDQADYFSANFSLEGLNIARVQRNGKWGYVNKEGKEVIPVIYDQIRDYFFKGICEAMREGKYGFVNTESKEVIPFIYDFVSLSNVGEGSIMAYLNGKRVYMDLQGNLKTGD